MLDDVTEENAGWRS